MGGRTVVVDVADELARRVASGRYRPGMLLPSVRQVADEFGVNRATAQLILGRVESYGFADAQRGKGFAVRDVHSEGGLGVFHRVLRLSMQEPRTALAMFGEIVEAEREIALSVLLEYAEGTVGVATRVAIDELEIIARQDVPDQRRFLETELLLLRSLLTARGRGMQRAILNSIGEMVLATPEAVSAYCTAAAPDLHVLVWRALAAVVETGGEPSVAQLALFEDIFGAYHEGVVRRFGEIVGAAPDSASFELGA
ncbi:GntR family transcriptional regulator [Nocardia uniformis]|uniref:GntR family transcriptional regulator n=1 Tax=Nocardia uniformis TaxID=53432 RepID=A0A849CD14_9NOCA|nr:GntR family transcriptional regulator [Nocardia uniformis]NNH70941.1 GntR family transcriptional regulator [Nocardia uniformis]